MATTTDAQPWQAETIEQLGRYPDDPTLTHAVLWIPPAGSDEDIDILDRTDAHTSALVSAEDWATKVEGGEVRIVKLDDLIAWNRDQNADVAFDALEVEPRRQNVEDEPPARELEQDTDADTPGPEIPGTEEESGGDEEADGTPPVEPTGQTKAFDDSDYEREDLQIPKIDGSSIDRIALKFGGEIHLDRSDPADVKLYNRLRFGRDVTLQIEGRCNAAGAKGATDREGDLDVVIGVKGVKVHTVYLSTAEEL